MSNMQATLRALLGDRVAAGAGRACQRPAVRLDLAGEIRDRGARRARARDGRHPFVGAGHLDNVILRADGDRRAPVVHRRAARPAGAGLPYGETHGAAPWRRAGPLLGWRDRRAGRSATRSSARRGCSRVLRPRVGGVPARPASIRVFTAIDAFAGGAPQFDDITILVARRLPVVSGGGRLPSRRTCHRGDGGPATGYLGRLSRSMIQSHGRRGRRATRG